MHVTPTPILHSYWLGRQLLTLEGLATITFVQFDNGKQVKGIATRNVDGKTMWVEFDYIPKGGRC